MKVHAQQVEQRFGAEARSWSSLYEQTASRSIYIHNLQRRKQCVLEFLKGVQGRVLEVGCGAGNVILSLPENRGTRIFGADFSSSMLRQARENANGRKNSLSLLAADALELPFRNGAFGTLLCLGVLEYIPDYKRVLSECHRILEPGGRFIVSVPNVASPFIRIDDLGFSLKNTVTHSLPTGIRRWLKARLFGRQDKPYINGRKRRFNPQAFTDCFRNIGFRIEEIRYHTFGFGLLNGAGFNVRLSERLESRAHHNPTLEKFGWTCILKAIKS